MDYAFTFIVITFITKFVNHDCVRKIDHRYIKGILLNLLILAKK